MKYIHRQTQLPYILLIYVVATSFGLGRQPSGQNTYKNLNAGVYNVLFLQCHGIPFTIV